MPPTFQPIAGFPNELQHSLQNPQLVYRLAGDLFAVRTGDTQPPAGATPLFAVATDSGETIGVYRGNSQWSSSALSRAGAVYRAVAEGRLVVPTGRVLVRFAEGADASERAGDLTRAGYRIVRVLAYAPHSAWLEAADGSVKSALNRIGRLQRLAGVVNVEPQLLAPRAEK